MKNRTLSVVVLLLVAAVMSGCRQFVREMPSRYLESWNAEAASYKALVEAVDDCQYYATKVAVFDFDGTLFCERDRTYFDWVVAARYVQDYSDRFTDRELRIASDVISSGKIPDWESEDSSFMYRVWKGVPLREYLSCVNDYLDEPMPTIPNLKRRNALFKPMLEVIEYLKANGYRVFVCTGTDRWLARLVVPQNLVPWDDIIGSSYGYEVKYQTNGRVYDLVMTGEIKEKNLKANKIYAIMNEIGKYPLLVFGNSSGDYEMAKMTNSRQVFMVLCDDTVRDRGDIDEAAAVLKECIAHGWVPISTRNDWRTVYGK